MAVGIKASIFFLSKVFFDQFLTSKIAIKKYGKKWPLVSKAIPSRTSSQIRTHAQKFFLKIEKMCKRGEDEVGFIQRHPISYLLSFDKDELEPEENNEAEQMNNEEDSKNNQSSEKESCKVKEEVHEIPEDLSSKNLEPSNKRVSDSSSEPNVQPIHTRPLEVPIPIPAFPPIRPPTLYDILCEQTHTIKETLHRLSDAMSLLTSRVLDDMNSRDEMLKSEPKKKEIWVEAATRLVKLEKIIHDISKLQLESIKIHNIQVPI